MSDTEKLEARITQHQTRLADIRAEMDELERAPERKRQRLNDVHVEVARLSAGIKTSGNTTAGAELAEALREQGELESVITKLEREAVLKQDKLRGEEADIRDELQKITHKLNRQKFAASVFEYEPVLKQAILLSKEIRRLAHASSVSLETGTYDCLVDHIDPTEATIGGYKLFAHRPW